MVEKTRQKPIWYLDVDGVINALTQDHPGIPGEFRRHAMVNQFPINWDARVVQFLNDRVRQGLVEVVWLTTWEEHAASQLAPALGIDEFRRPKKAMSRLTTFPTRTGSAKNKWWKWESILAHTETDGLGFRDVIWTDDDLGWVLKDTYGPGPEVRRWVAMRKVLGLTTLQISPRPSRGLTLEHLAEIEALLAAQPIPPAKQVTTLMGQDTW